MATSTSNQLPSTQTQPEPEPGHKWFDLPKAILHRIARHLDWQTDLPRIRSVCPSWRARLPKNPPLLSTTAIKIPNIPSPKFTLQPSHFYFVTPLSKPKTKPQPPWLIRACQNEPNKYTLVNPCTPKKYFYPVPNIVTSLSLLNCDFQQLTTTYSLMTFLEPSINYSKKVVGGWALDSPFRFAVLAQIEPKHAGPKLLFWKFGDKKMSQVQDPKSNKKMKILDSAYYNKKFYSFELNRFAVGVIDPMKANIPWVDMEFHPAPDILLLKDERCVVSYKGCPFYLGEVSLVPTLVGLYLVLEVSRMEDEKAVRLIVYKMRESGVEGVKQIIPTWEEVESLDDHVFFIGYDTAFALPNASVKLPWWKPNSICLFNRQIPLEQGGYVKVRGPGMPDGVRCLDILTYRAYWKFFSLYVMGEDEKGVVSFEVLPKKVFTGLIFPPPPWVKWRCPHYGDVEIRLDKLESDGDSEEWIDQAKLKEVSQMSYREVLDSIDDDIKSYYEGEYLCE